MADIEKIGILGAGVMGRGIAQFFAVAGLEVLLFDAVESAAEAAREEICDRIARLVEKNRLSAEAAARAYDGLSVASSIVEFAAADLTLEVIYENLDAKRELLSQLEAVVRDDALIATNTSSFLVAEVGRGLAHPSRFLGVHFFNPAPLMPLVEVIPGPDTDPMHCDRVAATLSAAGHSPVVVTDTNGFLVNQLGRGYVLEAGRIVDESIAHTATVDAIMIGGLQFPLGPFALMDLTGLDVTYPASEAIFEGNARDPRYQPPSILRRRYLAGRFGKKNGKSFAAEMTSPNTVAPAGGDRAPIRLLLADDPAFTGASNFPDLNNLPAHTEETTEGTVVVPLAGRSLASVALEHGIAPGRLVGVDLLFPVSGVPVLSALAGCPEDRLAETAQLFGAETLAFGDSAGSVALRIALQLALIGGDLATRGVASETEIDTAARLALGHAEGPLARIRRLGTRRMETLRARIHAETGEPRFRASLWLLEAAAAEGHDDGTR